MKWLIVAVVVVVLGLGAWQLLGTDQPDASTSETISPTADKQTTTTPKTDETKEPVKAEPENKSSETTITYTNDGFSPNQVTIKAGSKVKFINQSSRQMWVASDPHPIHTDTPTFDSNRGIGTGETYEFTFTESGSHGYHNHLSSFHLGTVLVE